jgi:hypothetical protein
MSWPRRVPLSHGLVLYAYSYRTSGRASINWSKRCVTPTVQLSSRLSKKDSDSRHSAISRPERALAEASIPAPASASRKNPRLVLMCFPHGKSNQPRINLRNRSGMTSADIKRKDLVACDHPTSEMGLLRIANAQVRSLRADNPAADTCLRTNSSSSLRWEYGASTQFTCVFPVIRREILCSASRSKKRMVFLAVAPRR